MPLERSPSEATHATLRARAARARQAARTRIAIARAAIVAGVAAMTCGLALFIQSSASGSATASAHTSPGVPGSAQPLFSGGGSGGHGSSRSSGASLPGASSGHGDAVSGGS